MRMRVVPLYSPCFMGTLPRAWIPDVVVGVTETSFEIATLVLRSTSSPAACQPNASADYGDITSEQLRRFCAY